RGRTRRVRAADPEDRSSELHLRPLLHREPRHALLPLELHEAVDTAQVLDLDGAILGNVNPRVARVHVHVVEDDIIVEGASDRERAVANAYAGKHRAHAIEHFHDQRHAIRSRYLRDSRSMFSRLTPDSDSVDTRPVSRFPSTATFSTAS